MSGNGSVILTILLMAYVGAGEGQILSIINGLLGRLTTPAGDVSPTGGPVDNSGTSEGDSSSRRPNGFIDCLRKCDGRSRTCYFRLHIERYSVLGGACQNCAFGNQSDCLRPQCVTANGYYRSFIAVNRQLSAPAIQVCRGDRIVADVENGMPDQTTTIHWHGLRQRNSQYYDGVPYVTQCPIQPGSTFRYTFIAEESGTFFYHSHIGIQKMDGVAGPFIVRDVSDSQSNLYTDDHPEHVIFVGDWTNRPAVEYLPGFNNPEISQVPDTFLINGRGLHWAGNVSLPLAEFVVKRGRRYRFRLIGGTCMTCAVAIRFQGHRITAISADGNLKFVPKVVDSVILNPADRFDVILETNQTSGAYYIFAYSFQDFCNDIRQIAILRYNDSTEELSLSPPPFRGLGVQLNAFNSTCNNSNTDEICISQLQGVDHAPAIGNGLYSFLSVSFDFYIFNNSDLFAPGTYQLYDEPVMGRRVKSLVNNISFTFPPSPMISQFNEIPQSSLCEDQCYSQNITKPCSCTNFYNLPYKRVINVLIYDTGDIDGFAHPYHLHGYNFYIIRQGRFSSTDPQIRQRELDQLMNELNTDNGLENRPQKDTINVPPRGYVLTRFFSDNPGYWFMHCHFVFHLEAGMSAVFRVGNQTNLPPVPRNFPRCGNYLPRVE